jgi:hypothetical protein
MATAAISPAFGPLLGLFKPYVLFSLWHLHYLQLTTFSVAHVP